MRDSINRATHSNPLVTEDIVNLESFVRFSPQQTTNQVLGYKERQTTINPIHPIRRTVSQCICNDEPSKQW